MLHIRFTLVSSREQGKEIDGKKLLCSKENAMIRERFSLSLLRCLTITSARRTRTVDSQISNRPPSIHGAAFDIVAFAASAGGLAALSHVLAGLPEGFPAALVVVQHLDPRHRSLMADILSRRTLLQVKQAEEGDQVAPATVYIASPNRHLLVNPDGT